MRSKAKRDKGELDRQEASPVNEGAESPKEVAIKTANDLARRFREMVERRNKEDAA